MFDMIGKQFFEALRTAAGRRLGHEHPCCAALERAATEVGAVATADAQAALAALDPDVLAGLMADTHKALREGPAAILGAWNGEERRH